MQRLDREYTRCLGRSDLTDSPQICDRRNECARYRTIELDNACRSHAKKIVVSMAHDGRCENFMYTTA